MKKERSQEFPKRARLRLSKDFKFGHSFKFNFTLFMVKVAKQGNGRLGISISKKVLKTAVARNRIKRLLREAFRKNKALFEKVDLHFIANSPLRRSWQNLYEKDITDQLLELNDKINAQSKEKS